MSRIELWIVGALIVSMVNGCGQPAASPAHPSPTNTSAEKADAASTGLSAFHGLGKLAFVRDGRLYILDGQTDTLREVAGASPASRPTWSADGHWLAFALSDGNATHFRVAEADTGTVHAFDGLPGRVTGYAWAPSGSTLAVSVARDDQTEAAQVFLVKDPAQPDVQLLAQAETSIGCLRWSPDGRRLAYVTTLPYQEVTVRSDALEVVGIGENEPNEPTRWYVAQGAGIDLADWSPDGGRILFWVRPVHSSSLAADGLPLQSLDLGAQAPLSLGTTLLQRDWLSWNRSRSDLLLVRGGNRAVWESKALAVCDPAAGTCRDLPQEDGAVSLDPAWSPDGSRIAFVQAERRPGQMGFNSRTEVEAWVRTRTLWLAEADGTGLQEVVAAGKGVYSPTWAEDGRHILYVRENAVWVADVELGKAEEIISLDDSEDPFGFYGQKSWSARIAWYRGD